MATPHAKGDDAEKWDKVTEKMCKLEATADLVVCYDPHNKEIDLGIGRSDGHTREVVPFSLDALYKFFDDQRHKNLIVIIFEKHMLDDAELQVEVNRIRDYFVSRGYKRISIQQGLGGGRGEHLDYKVEQPGADQAATKSANKVPAKVLPPTPTSKDAPR